MEGVRYDSQPIHVSGNIWLARQLSGLRPDGTFLINVCIKIESGDLAAMEAVALNSDGTYTYKDKNIGTIDSPEFKEYIKKFQAVPDLPAMDGRSSPQNEEELYKLISETYAQTKSLKKTAKIIGLSEEKTRRILFTTGDYTCDTHEKVMTMLNEGKSLDDIAAAIGLNRHKVHAYLPYNTKF